MCGCTTVFDESGRVCSVSTCPLCLPVGAISWLIENGRQLDLFGEEGVVTDMRSYAAIEQSARDPSNEPPDGGLPF